LGIGWRNVKDKAEQQQMWKSLVPSPWVLVERHFDPRPVDMWALAIVYMEMRTGRLLWTFAAEGGDEYYDKYLQDRSGLWGIVQLRTWRM